jgi:hypothetical protein
LSERSVASAIRIRPAYVRSYVSTSQGLPFVGGPSNGAERYVVAHGLIRLRTVSVSTNGLKAEPVCRRP